MSNFLFPHHHPLLSIQLPAFFGWNLVVLTWYLISGLHGLSRTFHAYTQHVTIGHPTLGHLARALLEYSESTSDFPRVAPLLPPLQCAYISNIQHPIFVSVIISHQL